MISPPLLLATARILFWVAIAISLAGSFAPPSVGEQLVPWDKAGHFLAFYALTALAVMAFPGRHVVAIAISLCVFGGLIEIVQSFPSVHRDAEWGDWIADSAAIAAVLGPMVLVRWRDDWRRSTMFLR
jgi:VanZ family protein